MGKVENGYVRGLVGSVISRRVGDLNVLQGRPRLRKQQTAGTKAAGVDFGTASRSAGMIRRAFWTLILDYQDSGMINRLNAQVLRAMRANRSQQAGTMQLAAGKLHRLADFQFNTKCHMQDYLFADVDITCTASGGLDIIIPAFDSERDLLWSGNVTHCRIRLQAFAFDFSTGVRRKVGSDEYLIPLRTREKAVPRQSWHFDVSDPAGTVIIVGMSLEFLRHMPQGFHLLNDMALHPAAILGAFVV